MLLMCSRVLHGLLLLSARAVSQYISNGWVLVFLEHHLLGFWALSGLTR